MVYCLLLKRSGDRKERNLPVVFKFHGACYDFLYFEGRIAWGVQYHHHSILVRVDI